jgi:NADPH:quinone reductase-like Zn-dependent oxidoreductase
MKAIVLDRHGGPDVLRVRDVPDPAPGAGEVRVRVEAIGVNYAEILSRKELYGWAPQMPYTLGMEATGTIDALGAGVDGRAVGERVIVGAQHGAYAEMIVVPHPQALRAIDGFSIEESAAVAVNYLTAWVGLMEMARLRPADRVLVTASAGGVGTAAVQIAARFGCEVVGLAGSDEKLERIRALGAARAVNYRRADFEARLREAAGSDRFDVVLEVVGRDVFRAVWPVLAPFGRVVVAGFASLALGEVEPALLAAHLARPAEGRHPLPRARVRRPDGDARRLPPGRPAAARARLGRADGLRRGARHPPRRRRDLRLRWDGRGAPADGIAAERGEDRGAGVIARGPGTQPAEERISRRDAPG